ncbi:MAG: uroporphyrinogen-III synthase [Actinomycetota bacterium]|nr:uroporphyrinogen-III synthase [Actinomycetota bacterium]
MEVRLEDLRVWVTAARKGAELASLLQRRGARVVWAPTLSGDRAAPDPLLRDETDAVLAAEPSWVVASTGVGVRGWLEGARREGRESGLLQLLCRARVVARGAKAHGALRQLGVRPVFVSPQETEADVAAWLRPRVRPGEALAVQVHGAGGLSAYQPLERAGARLLPVSPYRCDLPDERAAAQQAVRGVVAGELDLVVCTSPPAARNLVAIAAEIGLEQALVDALQAEVGVTAVGPVTAEALEKAGIPVAVIPRQARLGDLVRTIAAWWERRRASGPPRTRIQLTPAGRVVRIGDRTLVLGDVEFAVLAALVRRPDAVCGYELLAREAWGHRTPGDPAAIKHPVSRLRRKLGTASGAIETVPKVGYRYAPAVLADHGMHQAVEEPG